MDPTCGLGEKFRDIVLDQIWEQLLYLIYYHRNSEELKERFRELSIEIISIQHQIEEATNRGERIEEEKVGHWMEKVHQISEQVHKFHEEESQANTDCRLTSCPNLWLHYQLSKRAKTMTQEVADIYDNIRNIGRLTYVVPPHQMLELTNGESNEGIDSRVPIMNEMMEALWDTSVTMIGLCGLGGVGKTTISKDVQKKVKNKNMFEKVIMATVSQELNIGSIQNQIAEMLGMQIKETAEQARACRLCERLKQEKKMLLILDDLWEELDLDKVGIPFIEGCKILLTSRSDTLLSNHMNCKKIIKVGLLSDNEALELFQRIAELSNGSNSSDLVPIAFKIVKKCEGLPLSIATAAKELKGKDPNEYYDYYERLNNHLSRTTTGIKKEDAILKVSIEHQSRENRAVFLLAAMLSHDPLIEDLLIYSVGLDILEGIHNMKQAHRRISVIVSKLKSSNLFLDSFSRHRVTIHDVFREIALSIASTKLPAFIGRSRNLEEWPDEDMPQDCKRMCIQKSDISDLPSEVNGPSLEFFMFNSTKRTLTMPSMFFKSPKELKVLELSNVHFPTLQSLSFLQKLKALCLHSCLLEDITEVKSLKRLKVLSLANSKIQQLPVELAGLVSLQMLNLSHCSELKVIPPKVLSSLRKLEVLNMTRSFDEWKVEGSCEANENASLDELKNLPISSLDIHILNVSMLPEDLFLEMNLERCKILVGQFWNWWTVKFNDGTSKTLKLELEHGIHLKRGVRKLMEGVEDLYLYGSSGDGNVLDCHDGRGFPYLKHLRIDSNDDIKYFILNSSHHEVTFPMLKSLKLYDLKALEKLCQEPNVDTSVKTFHQQALLPKLEILELSNLNRLIPSIWDDLLSQNSFSNLKTLKVKECGFMKLVPLHVLLSLNSLEELEVEDCDRVEMVFDFEDLNDYRETESSSVVVVPLQKLVLRNLPKLKHVWNNYCQGNVSFPSLRRVDVSVCKSLTCMFPAASIAKGMFRDLKELRIDLCGVDAIIAKDQVFEIAFEFPSLAFLQLIGLPNLKNFYPETHTLKWPLLQILFIQGCDELEIFEREASNSSKIREEENMLDSKYPLLYDDNKVLHSLEELRLQGKQVEMIGSDGHILFHHFPNLKRFSLSLEKSINPFFYSSWWGRSPDSRVLLLSGDFEGPLVVALAAPFSQLTLRQMSTMGSLSSSFVSLSNLTHLQVESSNQLTILMTSSTARSLIHITHLLVNSCDKMQEIIAKHEGQEDGIKEIVFNKLQFLELDGLPKLKRFCSHNYTFRFPVLNQLTITRCPQFKTFSVGPLDTPSLKSVQLSQHYWRGHHEISDIDLNKIFYQERFVESREMVLDEYDVRMIMNDQFPMESCPQVEILRIEGFVEEGLTFPYALLQRFPHLTQLHVNHCPFGEILPSYVPPSSSTSFHNLTKLKVSKCYQLLYLVTNSTAKNLVNLETLEIDDCIKLEEIVRKETDGDAEEEISFNGLKTQDEDTRIFNIEDRASNTRCRNISKSLFGHNTQVLLPKLEILKVSNLLNNQVSLILDDQLSPNSFSNLKTLIVIPLHVLKSLNNLEKLKVISCDKLQMVFGFEDVNMPLNLTHLEVQQCHGLTTLMMPSIARSLVCLTHLSVRYCYQIDEIITKQEGDDKEDKEIFFSKLMFLELNELLRLKRFCGYDYSFKFPLLKRVTITECPQLTTFCSGPIHAPLLQSVQVTKYGPDKDIWLTDFNDYIQHPYTFKEVISRTLSMALNARNITVIKDVFPWVRNLYVESFQDEGATFPYSSLARFPMLCGLYVEHCSFEKIFPSQDQIIDFIQKIPLVKILYIAYLDKLKNIWNDDSQLPPISFMILLLNCFIFSP